MTLFARRFLVVFLFFLALVLFVTMRTEKQPEPASRLDSAFASASETNRKQKGHKEGYPDLFAQYHTLIRTADGAEGPGYGQNYLIKELEKARLAAKKSSGAIPWVEHGPANVSGRTRAIVVDPGDPTNETWLAASVSGGIWKTTTAGASWTHLTEDLPNLAFVSLVQAPSNPDILYAGTGEGFFNGDAAIGAGIFKSLDRGQSWQQLASTAEDFNFRYVNRLIISPTDPDLVVAATRSGILRTTNGGQSWTRFYDAVSSVGSLQIVAHPAAFEKMYATDGAVGVIRSFDSGQTWAPSSVGLDGLEGFDDGLVSVVPRVELAIAPTNPNKIFAIIESDNTPERIFVSSNGAVLWTEVEMENGAAAPDIAGPQGWYNLSIAGHPQDENILFVGGLNIYRVTLTGNEPGGALTSLDEEGTKAFLSFVTFGTATHFDGRMRTGLTEEGSQTTASDFVAVEVRYGPGKTQKAHRFIPPDGPGIPFADYPYADYVDVPFEVWDITNNRQLMVSFRDRLADGEYDLIPRDDNNLGREYLLIHTLDYNAVSPEPNIAVNGGARHKLLYFFWPIGADETVWDPDNLPLSTLRINFESTVVPRRQMQQISVGSSVHVDQHILLPFVDNGSGNVSLITGNDGGVFLSKDAGATWELQGRGYNTTQFYGVDKAPGFDRYFGGTQDNGSWISTVNPSATTIWTHRIGGDGFESAWNQQDGSMLLGSSQFNAFSRSVDGGSNFVDATSGLTDVGQGSGQFITTLDRSIDNPFTVFTIGKSGVWKSKDFGGSWLLRAIPSSDWDFVSNASGKVRVSLANSQYVWAGYEMDPELNGPPDELGKIHVSSDFGDTFSPVPTPASLAQGRISGLATHPTQDQTAFVLFSVARAPKILRTQDLGQTWEDLSGFAGSAGPSTNGFPDVAVYDLLVIPERPFEIWAGTEIGLFISKDNGVSWFMADNGLPSVSIWQIRVVGDRVIIATHGRGVWSVDQALSVAVEEGPEPTSLPSAVSLAQNYPNPFNPQTTISFTLSETESVSLAVYDITGRKIATLLKDRMPPGSHSVNFDASNLASGTYLYRLKVGEITKTKTMILIK